MKHIVSASKRTDIPAFHWDWFKEAVEKEEVEVINPFTKQLHTKNLSPEVVGGFVFWSKDYHNFLQDYSFLEKYKHEGKYPFYFHFTINSPNELEKGLKHSLDERITQAGKLAELFGADSIMWRFDPIIHWISKGEKKHNLDQFIYISEKLSEFEIFNCTFSFVNIYPKVNRRTARFNIKLVEISDERKENIVNWLVENSSMTIHSCASYNNEAVQVGRCVDGERLSQLWNMKLTKAKSSGQRDACACHKNIDIGSYEQKCSHNCIYCYARPETKMIELKTV